MAAIATLVACVPFLFSAPPEVDSDLRYFGFGLAVLVSAILGGLGPGLFTTGVSALLNAYFLIPPLYSFQIASPERAMRLLFFACEGILLSFVGHSVRREVAAKIGRSLGKRYGSAVIIVSATVALKLGLGADLAHQFPFSFFCLATALSSWLAGLGPGLLATLLSASAARFFFLEPVYSLAVWSKQNSVRVVLFMIEATVISYLSAEHPRTTRVVRDMLGQVRKHAQRVWQMMEDARALKSISRDVIWEWNLAANPIASRAVRLDPPESRADPVEFMLWLQQIHPKDRLNVMQSLRLAVEEGRREWFCEYRRLHPSGGYVQASDHAYIIRDAAWNAIRVIGRSADVTEAKFDSRALKSAGEYHAVFESNPVAMLLVDNALHVLEANEAACAVFGYTSREFSRQHVESLFDEASRASVLQVLLGLESADAHPISFETDCIRADGDMFRTRVNAAMILDMEGRAVDRIITFEELT